MQGHRPPTKRWPSRLLAMVVLPIAGWMLYDSTLVFRSEWATLAAREQVLRWAEGRSEPEGPQAWAEALNHLQLGLALTPKNPALHERLGDLHAVAGRRDWANAALREKHFKQAAAHYADTVLLLPGSAGAWAALASSRQAMADSPARVHEAWAQALKLGPLEGHVQPVLMQVALADWNAATPAMQTWAKALFDRSSATTQAQINVLAKSYGLHFAPDSEKP